MVSNMKPVGSKIQSIRTKLVLLLALVPLLVLPQAKAQTLGFEIMGGRSRIDIPFEDHNNLIVIPVVLNKSIPLKFVVDTGVRTAILTEKTYTDMLQVPYKRKLTMVGADGVKSVEAYVANNITLELPGVVGTGQTLLVLEEDYLLLNRSLGADVHGILGYELFSRFVVKINYERKIITLYEPGRYRKPRSYQAVPITIEDTKPYIFTDITLEDSTTLEAKLMIDTGASHPLLFNLGADARLRLPQTSLPSNLGRSLGGNIDGHLGRINTLRMAPFSFNDIISSFAEEKNYVKAFKVTGRHGTLGGGITNRFTIVFDYFRQQIYLKKNHRYRWAFEYNMSGIDLIAGGPKYDKILVKEVAEGSVGHKAGVLPGDEVILVNGNLTHLMSIKQVNALFRQKNNKVIRMKVRRNGVIKRFKFHLKRIL